MLWGGSGCANPDTWPPDTGWAGPAPRLSTSPEQMFLGLATLAAALTNASLARYGVAQTGLALSGINTGGMPANYEQVGPSGTAEGVFLFFLCATTVSWPQGEPWQGTLRKKCFHILKK